MKQVIQGTGDELIAYLEKHRDKTKLTLIIPDEEATGAARSAYPSGAAVRNGVPLFPTQHRTDAITMEFVKQLMDEES